MSTAFIDESGETRLVGTLDPPSPIESAEIVLTDAQIKTLRTPVTLLAPDDANHIPVITDIAMVLDDSHGIYVDPNAGSGFNLVIGYMPDPNTPDTIIMDTMTLADAQFGAPGVGVYTLWMNLKAFPLGSGHSGAGVYWGTLGSGGIGTPPQPSPGTIAIVKAGANNYTGGGSGNTLTIRLQYSQIKVVP